MEDAKIRLCFSKLKLSKFIRADTLKEFAIRHSQIRNLFNYLYTMSEYSLADAMKQFLNKSQIKGSVQALQIEEAWEQIMGKTIAKYTEKIQIHGQTLYITTSMAPLKQELLFQKEKIIERVNDALGEKTIKEVVIL